MDKLWGFDSFAKGTHDYRKTRGVKNGMPVIYIDCNDCGFATAWMPDEIGRDVARRWNQAHGQS